MTDTLKLKAKIMEKGWTIQTLSEAIDISVNSLSNKINNKTMFNAGEIRKVMDVLHLTNTETIDIFFNQKCASQTQKG